MSYRLERRLAEVLLARDWKLALAESCTGGLLGHRVTQLAGASAYFLGGVVAYANEVKERLLGVRSETLEAHGAVSRETALEMARGARQAFGAQVALAVTGIAGPTGGTAEKPVGLTWIAVVAPGTERAERFVFHGDREANKRQAAEKALALALEVLRGQGAGGKRTSTAEGTKGEPISVEAHFDAQGRPHPEAFQWRGRRRRVTALGRCWLEGEVWRMLVMVEGDQAFELAFLRQEGRWELRRAPQDFGGPRRAV